MPVPSREFLDVVARYKSGQLPEAERLCESVVRTEPQNFEARHLLGVILIARGDASRAERELALAVAGMPGSAPAHRNHGIALARLGRFEDALASFERALAIKPDDVEATIARAQACLSLGRHEDALAAYDKAVRLKADHAPSWHRRGLALMALGRFEAAIESCDRAIAVKPDYTEALQDRGTALYELKRLEEAAASYDAAIAIKPDLVDALCSRGVVRHNLDRIEEGLADLERAIALKPDFALAYSNRGNALQALKRPYEALTSYDRAIALDPNLDDAIFHRGMCRLSLGQMPEGWSDYESGRKSKKFAWPRPTVAAPDWTGEDLCERSILIFAEQGNGDVFQMCRYLPLLAERGAAVTFLVPEKLVRVLAGLKDRVRLTSSIDGSERFDFQLSLMGLPHRFATTLDTIPFATSPYLAADPGRSAAWREKLGGSGFKIGVCWQGGLWQGGPALKGRSFEAKEFRPLADIEGVRLISLQKRDGANQVISLPAGIKIETLGDFDAGANAFVDTAAVMEGLDLVVTCDTSVAHLAGALGKPTWVALRYAADWRWMIDRPDSPWYATLRLFRQTKRNDWSGVFDEMASELRRMISNR
ncbi:MAG TPA: tetratricopeptide repeat protein [Micropepsaceae bacterium]|nr:tetratricopeptide repeat protein [Micropepsaceae bacterium]